MDTSAVTSSRFVSGRIRSLKNEQESGSSIRNAKGCVFGLEFIGDVIAGRAGEALGILEEAGGGTDCYFGGI